MWFRRRNTLLSALCTGVLCTSRHAVHASSAGAAASAAVSALKNIDARYFVAGGICAATSHGITTPLDVVKTKMQASPDVYDKGVYSAALSICKTDGPQALLGGLGPTVVGYGVEGAMKFGVYEVLKPVFSKLLAKDGVDQTSTFAYICASVVAGSVASLLLCPMEFTRIRIVTDPNYKGDNMIQAFHKLIQENGVLSTFGGMSAMLSKQVPYTMAKQVSFDIFAGLFYSLFETLQKSLSPETIKWLVSISAAFVASLFACIFSQPGDVILTETYKGDGEDKSFSSVVGTIYGRNGLSTFFTGTGARILHVGMIISSQLVLYDLIKQLLGLPATGSH
jgi:solute carrier family 25 phosphate transporter 3